MKKIFFSLLLLILSVYTRAQTATYSVTAMPCNHDGVLVTTFTGLTPPITVRYQRPVWPTSPYATHTIFGLTDTLTTYSGAPVQVSASDGTSYASYTFGGAPPFNYVDSAFPALCPTLGHVTATVTGGTPPYSYQWFDANTKIAVGSGSPLGLPPGKLYGVTVTDAAGCVYSDKDKMYDTGVFLTNISAYSVTATSTTANCTNGTATAVVGAGATAPLSYSWSNGATTPSIAGLTMGSYYLTVTDAIGCSASASTYVPQFITISAPITATDPTCTASDGSAIVFGSGGVAPYTYLWDNGATTQSQSGLSSGTHKVVVTDANGCIGAGMTYLIPSTPITVTYAATPTLCTSPTGSATLTITGGTSPYTTTWYTSPPQTGVTATALPQGSHSFQTVDALGCVQNGTVVVPPINLISASFVSTPSICTLATGSMAVTASGGVTPYTYAWNTGGTTSSIAGIPSSTYHVTITDAMGCSGKFSEYLPYSSTLGVGLSGSNATCIFVSDGTLTATPSGGTTPYSFAWTNGGSTSTVTGLASGIPYWVTVTDALGCTATRGTTLPHDTLSSCYCTISGTVYDDLNGNCIQDAGENGIDHIKINVSGRGYTFTDATGHYEYKVPSGTYTVSENVLAYYPLSPCQSYSVSVSSVAGAGCVLPVDFANNTYIIRDMHICTWDYGAPVPGHTYPQITVVSNNGTIPESKVYTGYAPDGQLFAPSIVPGAYFHGTPYWYSTSPGSIPTMAPGSSQAFLMNYMVPTSIPLGTPVIFKDSVAFDSPMVSWVADYSPWNNVRYFTTNVVASFDPNFKEVYPKGTGAAGIITRSDTVLEYMVHFQNTGSYQAENIRVVDTLDDNIDWKTLKPIFNSAAQGHVSVDISGGKHVATFTFNNINLPPVTLEPIASNGMFTYSVSLKSGLAIGTQIKNSASIYFDYNTPVKTNQTRNTIVSVLLPLEQQNTAMNVATDYFNLFPNPANNTFSAIINTETAGPANINITDASGRMVITKVVSVQKGNQSISMNVNQLSSGTYFVSFTRGSRSQTQKLVIIKQ